LTFKGCEVEVTRKATQSFSYSRS